MKKQSKKTWALLLGLGIMAFTPLNPASVHAAPEAAVNAQVVSVNRATAEELQTVRGIGPALASRIVDYRSQNGPFNTLTDLQDVKGIGSKKFNKIKNSIKL